MNFIYIFCKIITYCGARIFFKKKEIIGLENMPTNVPVVLYANHNNAFVDSMLLHFALNENLYTLTRGDVFSNKIKSFLLRKFNIIPVYRMRDGISNLHKNAESFDETIEVLKQKKKVVLFPEGDCVQEKRLRTFKKGMARIVFDAENSENFNLGIVIIPVAINYNKPWQFRSSYQITIGKPVQLKTYENDYKTNAVKAINALTINCFNTLKTMLPTVENPLNDETYSLLSEMKTEFEKTDKLIADKLNILDNENAISIRNLVSEYNIQLKNNKIKDWVVAENESNFGRTFFYSAVLIFIFPIYLVGLILNYLSFKIPYLLTLKMCKNREFYTSINMNSSSFIWVLFYVLYILVSSIFIADGFVFIANFFVMPITGYVALWYWETAKKTIGKLRWLSLTRNDKTKTDNLVSSRKSIIDCYSK